MRITPDAAPPSDSSVPLSEERVVLRQWGVGPMSYCVPAYLCLVIASACVISIPTHLTGYRERGVLKRYPAASLSVWVIAGSELIIAFALSAATSVVLLVATRLVYDFESPATLLGVIAVFYYLTLGLATMGLLLGGLVPTARAAQGARPADLVRDVDGRGAGTLREVLTGAMG